MPTLLRFVPQFYRDSVSLMQFARGLKAQPGVTDASAVMATAANLALLAEAGLLAGTPEPRPDDLLLVLTGDGVDEALVDQAQADLLRPAVRPGAGGTAPEPPASIALALRGDPELNWALISVPGDYAAAEALKALAGGLHVMLFSDNVPVEQEAFLKDEAARRGLLLLGPDCGTSVVHGTALGFANRVAPGPVGLVSASGTGLQEVSSLLDRWGCGVSQALGTGGRDLKEAIAGRAALACLDVLAADEATKVVVLMSKPPAAATRRLLDERLRTYPKPVVTCFLGDPASPTLAGAARQAFERAMGRPPSADEAAGLTANPRPEGAGGRFLRGLYAGGTLCGEAALLASARLAGVSCNVSLPGLPHLDDPWTSQGHCFVDLGEDEFTRGRPHPMIDQSLRLERLAREASDPETAALLVDVVLGYGAHDDPATELARAVAALPRREGRRVPVFASVTGTEADPQGWSRSLNVLRQGGLSAFGSNEEAVLAAVDFVSRGGAL